MPIFVSHCHFLYNLLNVLVGGFHCATHLRPIRRRVMMLDLELHAEFSDHLVILPERAGFSNMHFIGSILEINKVVGVNIYCLSRRAAQAKALQVFSSCEYLVSQSVNFFLRKYIACSFRPDSSCCPNTHPNEFSNTVKYMIRGLPSAGGIRIGGF